MQAFWEILPTWSGKRRVLAWSILALTTLAVLVAIELDKQVTMEATRTEFKARHTRNANDTKARIEDVFHQIHRGLRLISRLPGVRTVDRHGHKITQDAQASAQEVYNNLAQSVAVSEVYIVPVDFDPDAIDPITGNLQEPITTFDDLIVGRTADQPDLRSSRQAARLRQIEVVEEIEIHEYRLMKKQIALLKDKYPTERSVSYINYPAVSGEEVITCDNTRFSPSSPNDDDRKGLVYSVPFYGNDNKLRGIVTAVILTGAIRDLIPDGTKAIIGVEHKYLAGSKDKGIWRDHISDIRQGRTSPNLEFSTILPLRILDVQSKWLLWMSLPNSELQRNASILAARDKAFWRWIATIVVAAMIFVLTREMIGRHVIIAERAAELEAHVEQRTVELLNAKAEADAANSAKGQFLANMSHEIRTPLGIMLGVSDALAASKLSQEQAEQVDVFRGAGRTLLDLVNSVLDMAAIEAGKLNLRKQPTSIKRVVYDLSSMFSAEAQAKGIVFKTILDDAAATKTVGVDVGRLKQILINLVGNAIKFTHEGHVIVAVRCIEAIDNDHVVVEFRVSDTGIGISPEVTNKIFDAFEQVGDTDDPKHEGTGLGLAIANALVKRMSSKIEIDSEVDKGTTFKFSLNLQIAANHTHDAKNAPERLEGSDHGRLRPHLGLSVLLAEDNPILRGLTSRTLEGLGCQVTVVGDGSEAVNLYRQHKFDLILMDCQMPVLDGYAATRAIRRLEDERRPAAPVPIVALTAHGFDNNKKACLEAGMTGFVSKPFTSRQISDALLRCTQQLEDDTR